MKANEYQKLAMRTNDRKCTARLIEKVQNHAIVHHNSFMNEMIVANIGIDVGGVINACFGLSGETGELVDAIKKNIFHGHPLEKEKIKKELGDVCWYVAMMCESFGFEMEEVMQTNIDKLKARYPEGFSTERSMHRKEGDI